MIDPVAPLPDGLQVTDRMTRTKAATIVSKDDYAPTGWVLTHHDGRKCIVDMGAVRWVEGPDFFEYMQGTDAVRAENDRLRAALADKVSSETMLSELSLKHGHINLSLEGGACRLFADAFADQFIDSRAINYVEASFASAKLPGEQLVVTLQRSSGKTPHQCRQAAEAEVAELRAQRKACETMDEAEKLALVRGLRETAQALGLDPGSASPAELVQAAQALHHQLARVTGALEVLRRDYAAVHGTEALEMQPALHQADEAVRAAKPSHREDGDEVPLTDADAPFQVRVTPELEAAIEAAARDTEAGNGRETL